MVVSQVDSLQELVLADVGMMLAKLICGCIPGPTLPKRIGLETDHRLSRDEGASSERARRTSRPSQAAQASSVVFAVDPVHPQIAVASKTLETHRAT